MTRPKNKVIVKKLTLTLPIPETQEGHDYMLREISELIHNLQKQPYLQHSEAVDKINKPFTHTWEIKGRATKVDKLYKMIEQRLKEWNQRPTKLILEIENE